MEFSRALKLCEGTKKLQKQHEKKAVNILHIEAYEKTILLYAWLAIADHGPGLCTTGPSAKTKNKVRSDH